MKNLVYKMLLACSVCIGFVGCEGAPMHRSYLVSERESQQKGYEMAEHHQDSCKEQLPAQPQKSS